MGKNISQGSVASTSNIFVIWWGLLTFLLQAYCLVCWRTNDKSWSVFEEIVTKSWLLAYWTALEVETEYIFLVRYPCSKLYKQEEFIHVVWHVDVDVYCCHTSLKHIIEQSVVDVCAGMPT